MFPREDIFKIITELTQMKGLPTRSVHFALTSAEHTLRTHDIISAKNCIATHIKFETEFKQLKFETERHSSLSPTPPEEMTTLRAGASVSDVTHGDVECVATPLNQSRSTSSEGGRSLIRARQRRQVARVSY